MARFVPDTGRHGWSRHAACVLAFAGLISGITALKPFLHNAAFDVFIALRRAFGLHEQRRALPHGDFDMFWAVGDLLRHGSKLDIYNVAALGQVMMGQMHYPSSYFVFVYSPINLPLFAAFSLLPVTAGYLLFDLAGLCFAGLLLKRGGFPTWCVILALLAPATSVCLLIGQLDLLCGALLVFGLARLEARPRLAGMALGLLALKPQYALLVPVAVLARRRWDTAFSGALTLAALAVLSLFYGGPGMWRDYLTQGQGWAHALLEAPFLYGAAHRSFYEYQYFGVSVFWMLRSLQASLCISYAVQALSCLLAAAFCWHLWRQPDLAPLRRAAITVLLVPFTTPYAYTDMLCMYSAILPLQARRGTPWRNAALAWLWASPMFARGFIAHHHLLIMPPLMLAALALALQKAGSPVADTRSPAPPTGKSRPAPAAAQTAR